MSAQKTRLEDVTYYLPLYDEDGDLDPGALYHRAQIANGRDFAHTHGRSRISDNAAHFVHITSPASKIPPVSPRSSAPP